MRILFFVLLTSGMVNSTMSQSLNYEEIFGDNWNRALAFERENRGWIEPILVENNISYPLAIAIIFPELVRYSALRDKMEITLLKALYINLGEEYANFSIGQFQMKPSFAEIIREEAASVMGRKSDITFNTPEEYNNIKNYRKSIVDDLEDFRSQINYLIVFIKICEKKFNINMKDDNASIGFIATAYNYGIDKSAEQIGSMNDKKFYNTTLFKSEMYSYAEISLFWFENFYAESSNDPPVKIASYNSYRCQIGLNKARVASSSIITIFFSNNLISFPAYIIHLPG